MDALAQKILDYLHKTDALELGASPWGTYEEDETVWPFDFERFAGKQRSEHERLSLPESYIDDIARALNDEHSPFDEPEGFSAKVGESGVTVSWDVCAWYQPIHFFGSDWGIFMREECLIKLAVSIARNTDAKVFHAEKSAAIAGTVNRTSPVGAWAYTDAEIFLRAAIVCLYLHEHYHHRIECLGIRLQVITRSPL
jgi:hypothetical protein